MNPYEHNAPEWYLQLFWKECEENFPISILLTCQEDSQHFNNDVFLVKIKDLSSKYD